MPDKLKAFLLELAESFTPSRAEAERMRTTVHTLLSKKNAPKKPKLGVTLSALERLDTNPKRARSNLSHQGVKGNDSH